MTLEEAVFHAARTLADDALRLARKDKWIAEQALSQARSIVVCRREEAGRAKREERHEQPGRPR